MTNSRSIFQANRRGLIPVVMLLLACASGLSPALKARAADPAPGEFLLVRRSLTIQPVRQVRITEQTLEYLNSEKGWTVTRIADCIALVNPAAAPAPARADGLLVLADGQRLPGSIAIDGAKPATDSIAWEHPWLGRMDVPLKVVQSVLLAPGASPPPAGKADVIVLANGDRQEGLITSLGKSVTIEVDLSGGKTQPSTIPLKLVSAITMITPRVEPSGRRVWFTEGTVIDVQSIGVKDDGYVQLSSPSLASGTQPSGITLAQIAGIRFDPKAVVPLASLAPTRVEGPPTRFILPKPQVGNADGPLGLAPIEFRGPIVVRYALPPLADPGRTVRNLAAEASLPRDAFEWGDYELVIRSNDEEVFRARLNAAHPAATINVAVPGRELTIELTAGAHGPVQDRLILDRAMLLSK